MDHSNTQFEGGIKGADYQFKLQILLMLKAILKDYEFQISTESSQAGKFDDIVLKYKSASEDYRHVLLQLKHKRKEGSVIDTNMLLQDNGHFSIVKYFKSWQDINSSGNLKNIEQLILYTNANLNTELGDLKLIEVAGLDLLRVKNPLKIPTHYKISEIQDNHILYQKLRGSSDCSKLVKELYNRAKDTAEGKIKRLKENEMMYQYRVALLTHVLDVKNGMATYKEDFINNCEKLSVETSKFRQVLESYIQSQSLEDFCKKETNSRKLSVETKDFRQEDFYKMKISVPRFFGKMSRDKNISTQAQLLQLSHYKKLLIELCSSMCEGKKNNLIKNMSILKFRITLFTYVLNVESGKASFREEFKTNHESLRKEIRDFRLKLDDYLEAHPELNVTKESFYEKTMEVPENFEMNTLKKEYFKILPENDVLNSEIEMFLKMFMLSVNQPSENELNDYIKKLLSELIQLNDERKVNLLYITLKNAIVDKFKEGVRLFCTEMSKSLLWDCIFDIIKAMDLPPRYNNVVNFRHVDSKLINFLKSGDAGTLLHLKAAHTFVGTALALFAHRTSGLNKFFILPLSWRSKETLRCLVTSVMCLKSPNDLLILECDDYSKCGGLETCPWSTTRGPRIILVTKSPHSLPHSFGDITCVSIEDASGLENLCDDSLRRILDEKITFMERRVKLGDIIGQDKSVYSVVNTTSLLNDLLTGNEVRIGFKIKTSLKNSMPIEYRNIYRSVEISNNIFSDDSLHDIIAIDMKSFNKLRKLVGSKNVMDFSKYRSSRPFYRVQYYLLRVNLENCLHNFKTLCKLFPEKNIHWLKEKTDKIMWVRTEGSIASIVKHRICLIDGDLKSDDYTCVYNNSQILKKKSHLVISDIAGAGKSTLVSSLVNTIAVERPTTWMVRVDLHDCTGLLDKIERGSLCLQPVDILINMLLPSNQISFTARLFRYFLENFQQDILILFDGFDEISPTYNDIVIHLLEDLKMRAKLIVTTRPNMRAKVEEALDVFAHTLYPLSEDGQLNILTKYWKPKVGAEKVPLYADALVKMLTSQTKEIFSSVYAIPLHLKLLANIFFDIPNDSCHGCKQFCESEEIAPRLPSPKKMRTLFRIFVESQLHIFLKKKNKIDMTNCIMFSRVTDAIKLFYKMHNRLAIKSIFENYVHVWLTSKQQGKLAKYIVDIQRGEEDGGLVTVESGGRPLFLHRSIAEYFAAVYFSEVINIQSEDVDVNECFIIHNVLSKDEYKLIRLFFDFFVKKKSLKSALIRQGLHGFNYQDALINSVKEGTNTIFQSILYCLGLQNNDVTKDCINTFISKTLYTLMLINNRQTFLTEILKLYNDDRTSQIMSAKLIKEYKNKNTRIKTTLPDTPEMNWKLYQINYEIHLLLMFILKGLSEDLDFKVTINILESGDVHCIIVEYRDNFEDNYHTIILLLKLASNEDEKTEISKSKINRNKLVRKDGYFSFANCFIGFENAQLKCLHNIEHVILYTNADLHICLKNTLTEVPPHRLLHTTSQRQSSYYKLCPDQNCNTLYKQLQETISSQCRKLITELFNYMTKRSTTHMRHNELICLYYNLLCKFVLQVNKREASFREEFRNNHEFLNQGAKIFRQTLVNYLDSQGYEKEKFFNNKMKVPRYFEKITSDYDDSDRTRKIWQYDQFPVETEETNVTTFMQNFRLAVNQPPEEELRENNIKLLEELIQLKNDTVNTNLYDTLFHIITNYLLNDERLLSSETCRAILLDEIIRIIGAESLSSGKETDKSLDCNVVPWKLINFIEGNGSGPLFHYQVANIDQGTALVLQALRCTRSGGKCFQIRLSSVSVEMLHWLVASTTRFGKTDDLLVLECDDDSKCDALGELLQPSRQGARTILVTPPPHYLPDILKERICPSKVLEKLVWFQGRKVKLADICGKNKSIFTHIEIQSLLHDLLIGKTVKIGFEVKILPTNIERRFYRHVEFSKNILTDKSLLDIIAIEKKYFDTLQKLIWPEYISLNFIKFKTYIVSHPRFSVLRDDCTECDFKVLCQSMPDKNIHWLRFDSNKIIWFKSGGHIRHVVKYKIPNLISNYFKPRFTYNIHELLEDSACPPILIIDAENAKKSTLVSSIASCIVEYSHSTWIVQVDLNDVMFELKQGAKQVQPLDVLITILQRYNTSSNYTINLLRHLLLNNERKVIIILSGYNAIYYVYYNSFISGLLDHARVVVINWAFVSENTEEKLGVFAYSQV